MLRLLKSKKAQNTVEYAILIALVIGIFSAMQLYLRRGMQARIKDGTDNIADSVVSQETEHDTEVADLFGDKTQYEPYYLRKGKYDMSTTSSEGTETGILSQTGGQRALSGATTKRTGDQTITGAEEDIEDTE